jgi:hypothetical protein
MDMHISWIGKAKSIPFAESAETILGWAPSSANDFGWVGVFSAGLSSGLSIVVDRGTPVFMRRGISHLGEPERMAQYLFRLSSYPDTLEVLG